MWTNCEELPPQPDSPETVPCSTSLGACCVPGAWLMTIGLLILGWRKTVRRPDAVGNATGAAIGTPRSRESMRFR
jgi:hypothetical protein